MPDLSMVDLNENPADVVLPPHLKRLTGRTRKNRRREQGEGLAGASFTRRSATIRCDNYKQFGHNKMTCQKAPIASRSHSATTSEMVTEMNKVMIMCCLQWLMEIDLLEGRRIEFNSGIRIQEPSGDWKSEPQQLSQVSSAGTTSKSKDKGKSKSKFAYKGKRKEGSMSASQTKRTHGRHPSMGPLHLDESMQLQKVNDAGTSSTTVQVGTSSAAREIGMSNATQLGGGTIAGT